MKKIVFICITVFLSITAFTQNEKEITPQVLNDFKAKYPEATKAKWSKEKDITKVEFINDDTKMKVEYLNNTWKKTYWGFKVESTPQKIKDYIKQYYVQYKISNVNLLTTVWAKEFMKLKS